MFQLFHLVSVGRSRCYPTRSDPQAAGIPCFCAWASHGLAAHGGGVRATIRAVTLLYSQGRSPSVKARTSNHRSHRSTRARSDSEGEDVYAAAGRGANPTATRNPRRLVHPIRRARLPPPRPKPRAFSCPLLQTPEPTSSTPHSPAPPPPPLPKTLGPSI